MTKPVIIVNFAYKSPTGQGYGKGPGALRTMLRYFQYRDRRNNWLAKNRGYIRWIDRGMGKHHREIFKHCEALQSDHVMAWTFVVSPAPDLMTLVPERQRRAFISDLTERVVEDYYAARGLDRPEFSFTIHTAKTKATDDEPSREHLHTHVVLPGTVSSMAERLPVYNNVSKGHEKLFREIAVHHFSTMLDQTIGLEWRRLRPDMNPNIRYKYSKQTTVKYLSPNRERRVNIEYVCAAVCRVCEDARMKVSHSGAQSRLWGLIFPMLMIVHPGNPHVSIH